MILFFKRKFLVVINIFASSAFFISIGFFFRINDLSDSIFLILTIQGAVGIIVQISWHVVLPMIYRKANGYYTSIIISTAIVNLLILNTIYIILASILSREYPSSFNIYAAIYAFFFQGHIFFKNLSLALSKISIHYNFDTIGYFLSLILYFSIFWICNKNNINLFFIALIFSWGIIFLLELYYYKNYLTLKYSKLVTKKSLVSGYKVRFSSLLFSAKDYIIPLIIKEYGPVGSITIYSYANKFALSIFQTFPLNIVNYFYTHHNKTKVKIDIVFKNTAKRALMSYIFASFLFILLLTPFYYYFENDFHFKYYFYLIVISSVFIVYGIQSYEQIFARMTYYNMNYDIQFKADLNNSFVFFIGCLLAFYYKNPIYSLFGSAFAQFISLKIYKKGILNNYDP